MYDYTFRVEKKFLHLQYQRRRTMDCQRRRVTRITHTNGGKRGGSRRHPLESGSVLPMLAMLLTAKIDLWKTTTEQCLTKARMMTLWIKLMTQVT